MSWLDLAQISHTLGLVWGVGGATAITLIMLQGERHPEAFPHLLKVIPLISKLIMVGFILLVVSGLALMRLVPWPLDTNMLWVKHISVGLLVVAGAIVVYLNGKIEKLAVVDGKPTKELLVLRKKAKIMGLLDLVLWYLILILGIIL